MSASNVSFVAAILTKLQVCKEDKPCQSKVQISCECRRRKQDGKCGASKSNPWAAPRKLPCDDECARLKRNAAFAEAFSIAHDHSDDHVPYSDTTLAFFRENTSWALAQEREVRQFALDPDRKVLRCKPMQKHQRAFMHALAEDFGLDSESQDEPPLRAVAITKTRRFVSAPHKMLSQALRLRDARPSAAAKADGLASTPANVAEPFNALLLSQPRFGLTVQELDEALADEPRLHNKLETTFLPSEEVLLRLPPQNFAGAMTSASAEEVLKGLKAEVAKTVVDAAGLAGSVTMCHADAANAILRRERSMKPIGGGWNTVVGRAAQRKAESKREDLAPAGGRSGMVALGLRRKDANGDGSA
jgi:transcriptional repressor NF-X1